MVFKLPSLKDILISFVAGFFGIQIISLIISTFFPAIPIFRGGPIVLIMLLAVAIIGLLIVGIKLDELRRKENLIFIVILFGLLGAGYYFLPKYLPQIFAISPEMSNSIRSSVGSIMGGILG